MGGSTVYELLAVCINENDDIKLHLAPSIPHALTFSVLLSLL